jgi:hypothetical protein
MIRGFARDIETALRAQSYPVRVVYGPERLSRGPQAGQMLVVFERDRESGDGVQPAKGSNNNPRAMRVRDIGVVATVYASSSAPGAKVHEHEHVCDQLVDALVVAIDNWFVEGKTGQLAEYSATRMLDAAEFEADEMRAWPGCVYRLAFKLPRGVRSLTYTPAKDQAPGTTPGGAQPTATIARFGGGEARVHREGSDEAPEIVLIPGDPVDP